MKKFIAMMLALSFAAYPISVHASDAVALSDAEMDEIAAGEWVLAKGEANGKKSSKFNMLKVESESQANVKAISNANAVDSAVNVQTNVSNAAEGAIDVNHSNEATATNFGPGMETKSTTVEETLSVDYSTSVMEENMNVTTSSASSSETHSVTYNDINSKEESASASSSSTLDESASNQASQSASSDHTDTASDQQQNSAESSSSWGLDGSVSYGSSSNEESASDSASQSASESA